jgi:phosphate transport system substrate-binding protein
MNPICLWLALTFALLTIPVTAQNTTAALPVYKPTRQVSGTIRIWGHGALGHDYIESLVSKWETGFQRLQPNVRFDNELHGTASAIGSLYTGTGDIAIMGREIWPVEVEAFEEVYHYPPLSIDVVTGSLDIRNKDFALCIFVNKDNPIAHLSLPQIAQVFGGETTSGTRRGATWGDLGLTGEWAARPIHLYGFEIHRGFGYYLQQRVFGGSAKWNPDLVELGDKPKPDGSLLDAGQRIVDAVGGDPNAIGYSSLLYKNPNVRPVPIGPVNGPFLLPSHQTVADHSYVLTRTITAVINHPPGKATDPKVEEFLRYVLSSEGQQAVTEDGGYTALTAPLSQTGLRQLSR